MFFFCDKLFYIIIICYSKMKNENFFYLIYIKINIDINLRNIFI